jgi:peptidoglycan/LPS O-acetylase OafA/YrhL
MQQRLHELDALRGFAALAVVLHHLALGNAEAEVIFKYGATGVNLFFIISGFVIYLSISKINDWRDFVQNRFIRLYPTYWVCVTITAIVRLFTMSNESSTLDLIKQYLVNLTMYQYYLRVPDIDGVYWTLIVEICFYATITVFICLRIKNKIEYFGYIALIVILFHYFILQELSQYNLYVSKIYFYSQFLYPLINYFPLFFAGILFYKVKLNRLTFDKVIGLIVCFTMTVLLFEKSAAKASVNYFEYAITTGIYFIIWILYIKGKLMFIVSKATLFLGRISYSLYLLHGFVSVQVIIPFLVKDLGLNYWSAFLISLLLSISLAFIVTKFFEEPIIAYIKGQIKNNKLVKEKIDVNA